MTATMEISATELKERLDRGEEIVLLDIRNAYELNLANLDNSLHIPQEQLMTRLEELSPFTDRDVVVYCRTGNRSQGCVQFLKSKGFQKVFNLTGGLHAWSDDVDPAVMKY